MTGTGPKMMPLLRRKGAMIMRLPDTRLFPTHPHRPIFPGSMLLNSYACNFLYLCLERFVVAPMTFCAAFLAVIAVDGTREIAGKLTALFCANDFVLSAAF